VPAGSISGWRPPATLPEHASQLFARNVLAFLELLLDEQNNFELDFEDEVIAGACVTRGGEIVHEGARQAAGAPA
jgi:H+-translocating NAD(P) transhydrogenase subunit alpha